MFLHVKEAYVMSCLILIPSSFSKLTIYGATFQLRVTSPIWPNPGIYLVRGVRAARLGTNPVPCLVVIKVMANKWQDNSLVKLPKN